MTNILEVTIIHHVTIVFTVLWLLNSFNCCNIVAYLVSLIYLYLVHEGYVMRLKKKLQFEERRSANQRRALSDSETVRWLNHAVEKIWPICMEEIVSQKILLPIMPWFLQKYKPWTVKEAVVQQLYLGRSPPMLTEMRVLHESSDDDHLVIECGISFRTAEDMSGILAVKLTKRLGLGMWTKMHIVGMHVEGKVLVGVKFIRQWPYLGRMRVCFVEPPYFQMMVKPLFNHGLDVTELPGVAGWLDKLLGVAFEQTLVEPNMLVVDVEKFASPQKGSWFSVDVKEPIAHAVIEVLEADELKPSDLNGLADPYVKGQLGPYRFRTKTIKKTLNPKWNEEFKVPICTWESSTLKIELRDKDHLVDDKLGACSVNTSELRDGQRHDMWLPLQNIKVGRLRLAITIVDVKSCDEQVAEEWPNESIPEKDSSINEEPESSKTGAKLERRASVLDKFEPIDIEGQKETGIWVQQPGSEVAQIWQPRKGKNRVGGQIIGESGDNSGSVKSNGSESFRDDDTTSEESVDIDKPRSKNRIKRGLRKIGSMFRSPRGEDKSGFDDLPDSSPHANVRSVNTNAIGVTFVGTDTIYPANPDNPVNSVDPVNPVGPVNTGNVSSGKESPEGGNGESPGKEKVKDVAKSILKQAGKSAHDFKHVLSRKLSGKKKGEVLVESDSADDESVYTPVSRISRDEQGLGVSSGNLVGPGGSESYNMKEEIFASNVPVVVDTTTLEDAKLSEKPL